MKDIFDRVQQSMAQFSRALSDSERRAAPAKSTSAKGEADCYCHVPTSIFDGFKKEIAKHGDIRHLENPKIVAGEWQFYLTGKAASINKLCLWLDYEKKCAEYQNASWLDRIFMSKPKKVE